MELTATNVSKVLEACMFTAEETKDGVPPYTLGQGVKLKIGFHPERLEAHKKEIMALLMQLPEAFQMALGNSFLGLCMRADNELWGEHRSCDELLALGVAAGYAMVFPSNREIWQMMPGGMPGVKLTLPGRGEAATLLEKLNEALMNPEVGSPEAVAKNFTCDTCTDTKATHSVLVNKGTEVEDVIFTCAKCASKHDPADVQELGRATNALAAED